MSRELRVNRFTTTAQGLVPAPGTATGLFLRDDATWAAAGSVAPTPISLFSSATVRTLLADGSGSYLIQGWATRTNVGSGGNTIIGNNSGSNLISSLMGIQYACANPAGSPQGVYVTPQTGGAFVAPTGSTKAGGFTFAVNGGLNVVAANMRLFWGMVAATLSLNTTDPSASATLVGLSLDSADTNMQFITAGSAGNFTKTQLSPAVTPATLAGHLLQLTISVAPNSLSFTCSLLDVDTATTYTASVTAAASKVPGPTQPLTPYLVISNGTQAGILSHIICKVGVSTNYG